MKVKLLTLFVFLTTLGFAQSLSIARIDTSHCYEPDASLSNELIGYIDITNNSSNSIDVLARRIDKGYDGLTDSNAICWGGQCWTPSTSVSPFPTTLGPGQTSNPADFSAHVYPDGDGLSYRGPITYVFYDKNNPSDSIAVTLNYRVGTVLSIKESDFDQFSVYPNPATSQLNIKYTGMNGSNITFELVNMVGNKVYSKKLESKSADLKLDISTLPRGVYFYILKSDGKVSTSKKLVIK